MARQRSHGTTEVTWHDRGYMARQRSHGTTEVTWHDRGHMARQRLHGTTEVEEVTRPSCEARDCLGVYTSTHTSQYFQSLVVYTH
jgi:hypothetical protein